MRGHFHVCDYCNKAIKDPFKEPGWILIDRDGCKMVSQPESLHSRVEFDYVKGLRGMEEKELDFCSFDCFVNWLRKQLNLEEI